MLPIKGIQKTSLVDYPGKICSTIFIGGCNFRCPFCHNSDLVLKAGEIKTLDEDKIISFLEEKKKWIDAVCITGGEPTLYSELITLIKKIKDTGLLVKLDTNGTNPVMIKKLIDMKLVDMFSIDIKTAPSVYSDAAGVEFDIETLKETRDLLMNSGVDYEFRTTFVPGLVSEDNVIEIAEFLQGAKLYSIQQFRPGEKVLDVSMKDVKPYSKEELEKFKNIAEEKIGNVRIVNE